jgi:hypothetical protein
MMVDVDLLAILGVITDVIRPLIALVLMVVA